MRLFGGVCVRGGGGGGWVRVVVGKYGDGEDVFAFLLMCICRRERKEVDGSYLYASPPPPLLNVNGVLDSNENY